MTLADRRDAASNFRRDRTKKTLSDPHNDAHSAGALPELGNVGPRGCDGSERRLERDRENDTRCLGCGAL